MNESSKKPALNTVDNVVEEIIADLPLETRGSTANLDENEFKVLELTLGKYVRHRLRQGDVKANKELLESCIKRSGESLNEVDPAGVFLKELWKRLRETHTLRIVK